MFRRSRAGVPQERLERAHGLDATANRSTTRCGGGTMERTRRLETSGYEPSDGAYLAAMSLAQQEMAQLTASLAWKNQALVRAGRGASASRAAVCHTSGS